MFWSMVLTMGANIWSACMTGKNDYVPFVWSRGFAGLFGSAPLTGESAFRHTWHLLLIGY